MNPVSLADLIASIGSLLALLFLCLGAGRFPWKTAGTLLAFVLILTVSHDVGNFLEWTGISNVFDPVEDYLEVLTAALWAFFFYTFLQEVTEEALRRSEERYRRLFEVGNDAILAHRVDADGEQGLFIEANEVACQLLGYTREEFMRLRPADLYDEKSPRNGRDVLENLGAEGKIIFEGVYVARDGRRIPVEVSSHLFDLFGEKVILSIVRDITRRRATERKLREVQELDEKILDGSPVAFVLRDAGLTVLRVSRAFEKVTGYLPDQVLGKTTEEFMPDMPGKAELEGRLRAVIDSGKSIGPTDVKAPSPVPRFIRETIFPVRDAEGRVTNTLSVLEDITEQKAAQDALEESEARYRMLFDNIHDGVVLHEMGVDGRPGLFLEVNARFCAMVGYSRQELLELTPVDLLDDGGGGDAAAVWDLLLKGQSAFFERTLRTRSGKILPCELSSQVLSMGGRTLVFFVVRDITERKEAEDRIRTSLAEKETLLREIHHRVKNNLQVISGMLNLQSQYIKDPGVRAIYKESQNRIKTMALIHEELYQREDLAQVNLAGYIKGLAMNLLASYTVGGDRIQLVLDLEDLDIVLDTAIPCGLIFNELFSNALKHAFPADVSGKIGVSLRRGEEDDRYILQVSDDGAGFPAGLDYRKVGSMGMQLVRVLVEQLGGTLELSSRPGEGTTFTVSFREYREAPPEVV